MSNVFVASGPLGLTITQGNPPDRFARNGDLTDGVKMNQLAGAINSLSARRLHVLAQGGNGMAMTSAGSVDIGACKFHTSPNCAGVEVMMVLGRSTSATLLGSYQWTVGGVAQASRYMGGSTAGTNGPDDLVVDKQRFVDGSGNQLAGDTDYTATFNTSASIAAAAYVIYEVPRSTVVTGSAVQSVLGYDIFGHGNPILDRDISRLTDAMWLMYRRQGAHQFSFAAVTTLIPTQTGTTPKNICDDATTGYGANAAGFWTIPRRKNRLAGTVVNVALWARSECTTSDGVVRFSNSAGVIGSITGIAAVGFYSTTATLDATLSTSDLVIVEHFSAANAAGVVNTYSAGIYEYLT